LTVSERIQAEVVFERELLVSVRSLEHEGETHCTKDPSEAKSNSCTHRHTRTPTCESSPAHASKRVRWLCALHARIGEARVQIDDHTVHNTLEGRAICTHRVTMHELR